ncbi:alkaline phosphatase family protein [Rhodococcus sp. HNM0569]|uniref:alkaline phosphatase family protein n=1 Tax=Rhodococcus sp. HNM0569 TaxID=2716340 RepID=UPI00146BF52D|nr:alkaline phosphatase family protein [Rhodococcus sp. HNM0569]NLU83675.1 alkaline phosphatase family protein [Rhodococcus sp. HNM0569]
MAAPHPDVYSRTTLADVLPSTLAVLGVPGTHDALGLPDASRWVVLVVDGLGWNLLRSHADAAPTLAALAGGPIAAGFPTTTATSITSIGVGAASGVHGVTGYRTYLSEADDVLNWLSWRGESGRDERARIVPEDVQPHETVFERAVSHGVAATTVLPGDFAGSGLTRAALRGAEFRARIAYGDLVAHAVDAARTPGLVYTYVSELDTVGHVYGPGTAGWRYQLAAVDELVATLRAELPTGTGLLVTADHGMVTVADDDKIDLDDRPDLLDGVQAVAGEPRCRALHVASGAEADVAARWRAALGDRVWITTRAEAIASGLYGPSVSAETVRRIGDLVVVARDGLALVRRSTEPGMSSLVGQHGALTDDELLVPALHTVA